MCGSWETLPGTYRVCTVHRSWDGITVHTLWALMYRRHNCAVCRRQSHVRSAGGERRAEEAELHAELGRYEVNTEHGGPSTGGVS